MLQLDGRKQWTVYDQPFASWPRPDHVRRPSAEFMAEMGGRKQQFVLQAGDLLYIPRGVVHEATTNFSYTPSDAERQRSAQRQGVEGVGGAVPEEEPSTSSLHLTYGIETATHFTVEVSDDLPYGRNA